MKRKHWPKLLYSLNGTRQTYTANIAKVDSKGDDYMDFFGFCILVYVVGCFSSYMVYTYRVEAEPLGLRFWFWGLPLGPRLTYMAINFRWFVAIWGKMLIWPVVLVVWCTRGMPPSSWAVVGKKHGVPLVGRVKEVAQQGKEIKRAQ